MNLYFLRHAKAEPRSEKYKPDSKRPLTSEGEEIQQAVARGMLNLGLSFDLILTSPFVRAARTAEITAKAFKSEKVWTTNNLTPEANPARIIDEINNNYPSLEDILLIGHNPAMGRLISTLLTGDPGMEIDFKKSALCKLSTKDLRLRKCACLEWLLTPRQLQRLGKR